jgi:3-oxoacyl-[acyl-carrier-protein] synthase III
VSTRLVSAPARLGAVGYALPERVMTNDEFAPFFETSDEWIVQRSGIRTRRVVADGQYASHLAIAAVEDLLADNPHVDIASIDYIIAASTTPDYVFPGIASQLQTHFGLPLDTGAIDISAACAGFAYGVNLACGTIASGECDRVLVVVSEAITRSLDYTDRTTAILFGDGAAAAIVERSDVPRIFGLSHGSDGSAGRFLYRTATRAEINGIVDERHMVVQNGREVYRWVLENVPNDVERILARAHATIADIDWFVPHSANLRMVEALAKRVGVPMERTLTSMVEFGNTVSASIPLALFPAMRDGRVKPGERVLMVGFGGGVVTSGSVVVI